LTEAPGSGITVRVPMPKVPVNNVMLARYL